MIKNSYLAETLNIWQSKKLKIGLATVVQTWGSAPCPVGSVMFVNEKGQFCGSVSGGCIETQVISECIEIIKEHDFELIEFGVSDNVAEQAGLACGGKISIFVEALDKAVIKFLASNEPFMRIINVRDGTWLLKNKSEELGNLALTPPLKLVANEAAALEKSSLQKVAGGLYFFQLTGPKRKLILVGGVKIAQALIPMAKEVGFDITIVDPRPAFANSTRFPDSNIVCDWPDNAFSQIGLDNYTAVVALTHDVKPDDMALKLALRSNVFYIGALGSKKTHFKRIERLKNAGLTSDTIKRINAPIGLDIGAITPEEIALSIVGQIVKFKNISLNKNSVS